MKVLRCNGCGQTVADGELRIVVARESSEQPLSAVHSTRGEVCAACALLVHEFLGEDVVDVKLLQRSVAA